MPALTALPRLGRRAGLLGVASVGLLMIVALSLWASSAARAVGCQDSWTNTAGGSWAEGANWSNKAPPTTSEEACITVNGTYTVTLTTGTTTTVKSLSVGGESGTQTLVVANVSNSSSTLNASSAIALGAHGAVTLTDGAGQNGESVTLESGGSITNAGTITTETDAGGGRVLKGSLANKGTLAINANTSFDASKATLANEGTVSLANEKSLTVSSEASVTNASGGKIAATGSGRVLLEPKTSFTEGAGTTSGTLPVVIESGSLDYTGAGASTIAQRNTEGTLTGASSAGQSLLIENNSNQNASVTATSFTNGGTITLTDAPSTNGENVTLTASGTLTNTGTITTEADLGGTRILQGDFVNKGTADIDAPTDFDASKGAWTNEGALNVGEGFQLAVSNESSVTNASGNIAGGSGEHPGDVFMEPKTSFTQGEGTTSGTLPVIIDSGALRYTGAGASTIAQRNTEGTLAGNLASGQTLLIENNSNQNATVTASASFTNAGKITLTDAPGQNGESVTLDLTAGTLTNTGTITTEEAAGGSRFLQASLTNKGTIDIDTNTSYDASKATLTNEGALDVATGKALKVSSEGSVTNGSGGAIAGGASGEVFLEAGTAFTEGAGTTSGTLPVVIESGSLDYTGAGASTIAQRNTGGALTGASSAGQSLLIENNSNQNASVTATGFTNGGTITLTDGPGQNGESVTLTVSGTLTNTGTITTEAAAGGTRILQGDFVNKGTTDIDGPTDFDGADGSWANEGALNVGEGFQLVVSNESSVTNASGNIAGAASGDVYLEPKTSFTQGGGTTSGTLPVIIDSGALRYTGAGASTIAQRNTEGTLAGNLASGQTLLIENNSNQNATVTASASFTNAGKITLTDGPGQNGESVTLDLTAGTLTNTGTITTVEAAGGSRFLQADLTNKGTIEIDTNTSYDASKATLTNEGALEVAEKKTLTVSGEGAVVNGTGGKILAAGTGANAGQVFLDPHSAFTEGSGTTSTAKGTLPVVIESSSLTYTGSGKSVIAARNTGNTLTGAPGSKQTLSVQNNSSQNASLTAAASFTNSGTIILTDGPGQNGETISLVVASGTGTLTNKGTITAEKDAGGARVIEGDLKNEKTVSLSAGADLKVTGTYSQGKKATLKAAVAGASDIGALSVTGTASIEGTLALSQAKTFKAKAGETFSVLSSSALTGTFAKETGDAVGKGTGLYYKPAYSATGVTLEVTQATVAISPSSGPGGTVVTVSGSGFVPGDTIKLKFTDHKKHKTTLPSATVNGSGELSTEVTIPETAAEGAGSIAATSTETAVSLTKTFTVT
ncbi:MAG TPA: IPT/TIG domain-containing protein [Solirubrobacteraceae bacterium]|nr:IPT/TIG domain-containing protein [Solirubrobacteraceae bacterium]